MLKVCFSCEVIQGVSILRSRYVQLLTHSVWNDRGETDS